MSSKIVCLFRKNFFTIKKIIVPDTKKGTDRFSYSVASNFCECLLQELLSLLHYITGAKQIIQHTLFEQILCEQILLKNEDPDGSVAAGAVLLYSADFKW